MKTNLLNIITAAAFAGLMPAQAQDKAEEKKDEKSTSSSASSSVTTGSDGTATVTIEVNGKKETKTFKLGDGKPFTLKLKDGNSIAVAGGDAAGPGKQLPSKKEKSTFLGVATEPVSDEVRAQLPLKEGEGLVVTHVAPESPAAKAGIELHDILTRLDGQILVSADQLRSLVKMHKPGEKVKISTLRKGQPRDIEAALEEHETEVHRHGAFDNLLDAQGNPQWKPRDFLKNLNDKEGGNRIEFFQKELKDIKDKFPGVIVDKKAFIFGPDGIAKKLEGDFKPGDVIEMMRKHLDEANLPEEVRENIRKSVESALNSTGDLLKNAEKATDNVADLKKEIEKLRTEVEKAKGEIEKAKETPKPQP